MAQPLFFTLTPSRTTTVVPGGAVMSSAPSSSRPSSTTSPCQEEERRRGEENDDENDDDYDDDDEAESVGLHVAYVRCPPPYLDDEGGVGRDGHLGRGGQPLLQLAEGSRSNRVASSATGQGESEWPPDMMGVLI